MSASKENLSTPKDLSHDDIHIIYMIEVKILIFKQRTE